MKKYVFSLTAVIVAIVASSFTSGINKRNAKKASATGFQWYNFYGSNYSDMADPSMYGLDENNWPDCPPGVGYVYCEIYARPSQWEENEPDLTTIATSRYKSLISP